MSMCWPGISFLLLLLVCSLETVAARRCKYSHKGVEWSPCDPVLHVKTKSVSLRKGRHGCPKTKTITRACKAGIQINGCAYVPVSGWSECDPLTLTATRTLELHFQSSSQCGNNEVESRDCGKGIDQSRNGGKKKRRNGKWRNKKLWSQDGCIYKKGNWGDCDPVEKKMFRSLELKNGPSYCQEKKTDMRFCSEKKTRIRNSKRKHKGRRKKKDKKQKKRKEILDHLPPIPPKLTEMRVWPLSTSVEVSWKPPNHGTVRGYQVGYGISIPDVYKVHVNASVLHYIIQDLEPEQEYIVSVRARSKAGVGSPLYETVRTGRSKGSDNSGQLLLAPVEVRASTVSATAVEVSWSDSSVLKLRGGVEDSAGKMYTVRYMQLNHLNKDDKPKFVLINTTESSVLVEDLMPYTRYEFAVRVSQGSARSIWSLTVTNNTFAMAPSSKPAEFTADLEQSVPTTVRLTWQPPEEPNGPITGYVIFYSKDPILPDPAWATSVISGNRLSTFIKDLDPNSAYFFKIQAQNKEGVGPHTSPLTVTVPDDVSPPSIP